MKLLQKIYAKILQTENYAGSEQLVLLDFQIEDLNIITKNLTKERFKLSTGEISKLNFTQLSSFFTKKYSKNVVNKLEKILFEEFENIYEESILEYLALFDNNFDINRLNKKFPHTSDVKFDKFKKEVHKATLLQINEILKFKFEEYFESICLLVDRRKIFGLENLTQPFLAPAYDLLEHSIKSGLFNIMYLEYIRFLDRKKRKFNEEAIGRKESNISAVEEFKDNFKSFDSQVETNSNFERKQKRLTLLQRTCLEDLTIFLLQSVEKKIKPEQINLFERKVARMFLFQNADKALKEIRKFIKNKFKTTVKDSPELDKIISKVKRMNLSSKEKPVKNEKEENIQKVTDTLKNKKPKKSAEQLAEEERIEKLNNYLENPDSITPDLILKELENQGFKYTERFQKNFEKQFIKFKDQNKQNLCKSIFEKSDRKLSSKWAEKFYSWDFDVSRGGMRLVAFSNK